MRIGDVVRTRNIRTYFSGARGYVDFKIDSERKRKKQRCFVLLLLGIESMVAEKDEAIDPEVRLSQMGYWGEERIVEVLGRDAAEELVDKLDKNAKARKEQERATEK